MARLSPSMTFAMNALSNELKAKGIDVVNMSLGEPDFNTPEHVKPPPERRWTRIIRTIPPCPAACR